MELQFVVDQSIFRDSSRSRLGLMFVPCDQRNGRASRTARSRAKRHAAYASTPLPSLEATSSNYSQRVQAHHHSTRNDDERHKNYASPAGAEQSAMNIPHPFRTLENSTKDPHGILASFGIPGIQDLDTLLAYYLWSSPASVSSPWAKLGSETVCRFLWQEAMADRAAFYGMLAMVCRKADAFEGPRFRMQAWKCELHQMHEVRQMLANGSSGISAVLSCAGMARTAVIEKNHTVARIHLHAIAKMLGTGVSSPGVWLCSHWVDIRVAMTWCERPYLHYYVPVEWQGLKSSLSEAQHCSIRLAAQACTEEFAGIFDPGHMRLVKRLVLSLHETSTVLVNPFTEITKPPFALIYDALYHSCILHADVIENIGHQEYRWHAAQLVAICLKLCANANSATCSASTPDVQEALLCEGRKLLQVLLRFTAPICSAWLTFATKSSLWWTMACLTAVAVVRAPDDVALFRDVLRDSLHLNRNTGFIAFQAALAEYPSASWWTCTAWTALDEDVPDRSLNNRLACAPRNSGSPIIFCLSLPFEIND